MGLFYIWPDVSSNAATGNRSASFASAPDHDQDTLPAGDKSVEDHHPKPVVVVRVVRVVVVAVRTPEVVGGIVPRAAAQSSDLDLSYPS